MDALILMQAMQAMQLAQAVRDDVVGAQRDALLADLHLQMDSIWTAYGQHMDSIWTAYHHSKHQKNLAL